MNKLPNHTALKEWKSIIDALDRGEQVVLIRKGGLADPHFGIEADRFYLFPTNYHDAGGGEPTHVPITWQVRDLGALHRLEPLVALDRATIETRYKFRPDQAINVIAVRTFRLAKPVEVKMTEAYGGCRSWVSVDEEIDVDGSVPVLTDAELDAKIRSVEAMLAEPVASR
jgi:hypothetical protein